MQQIVALDHLFHQIGTGDVAVVGSFKANGVVAQHDPAGQEGRFSFGRHGPAHDACIPLPFSLADKADVIVSGLKQGIAIPATGSFTPTGLRLASLLLHYK